MWQSFKEGPHLGMGYGIGLAYKDNVGAYEVQCCWVSPGNHETIMTGNLSQVSREGIMWCKSFIETYMGDIITAFGLPPPPASSSFYKPGVDLHVHVAHDWEPISASYQMGVIFISMVSLLVGRRAREGVVILGDMGNLGGLLSAWEVTEEMVEFCRLCKFHTLVVGEGTTIAEGARRAAGGDDDECYGGGKVEIRIVSKVLDAIPLCFEGVPDGEEET